MTRLMRFLIGVLVAAFMVAGLVAQPAMAREKGKAENPDKGRATQMEVFENDKVRILEVRYLPGDESGVVARPDRVILALKGGTLMGFFADGTTEKLAFKTGGAQFFAAAAPFKFKNVGKTEVLLYTVDMK
jgi:hypothetical protein